MTDKKMSDHDFLKIAGKAAVHGFSVPAMHDRHIHKLGFKPAPEKKQVEVVVPGYLVNTGLFGCPAPAVPVSIKNIIAIKNPLVGEGIFVVQPFVKTAVD